MAGQPVNSPLGASRLPEQVAAALPMGGEDIPIAWIQLDDAGRALSWNRRCTQMLGERGALLTVGTFFNSLLSPASRVYFDLGVLPALQLGQEMREVQLLLRAGAGEELPVLCTGQPQPDQKMILAILPIPGRRRLEDELISIRNAVEQVPGAVFQFEQRRDGRLQCRYFSSTALSLPGQPRQEIHLGLWERMDRRSRREFASTLRAAANGVRLFQFDLPVVADQAGESPRWLHIQARAQQRADGCRQWFGHVMDVSRLRHAESALAESEQRYRTLAETSPVGIFHFDAEGRCQFANASWCRMFGVPSHQGSHWLRRIPEPERSRLLLHWQAVLAGGAPQVQEFRVASEHDGPERHVRLNAQAVLGSNGRVESFVGTVEDVTERIVMERALAEGHELLRVTLESIGDGVVTTDLDGCVRWFNPVAEAMSGWSTAEARGRPLDDVLRIVDSTTQAPIGNIVAGCLEAARSGGEAHYTLWSRNGIDNYSIEKSIAPIRSANGASLGVVLVFHDVSEQRKAAMEIERRATYDALTGLLNRSEFERRMERVLSGTDRHTASHSLLYIDLDQFKLVNDACGHAAGDKVLREVAGILQSAVRPGDSVARIGGDEFAIILENCGLAQADLIGDQICRRMEDRSFIAGNRPFRLGTSIGLVQLDDRWQDVTALLQAADTACYAAKESGRNRVYRWHDADVVQARRAGETRWAARLAEALDHERLELFGQRIEPTFGGDHGLHCEILLRLREADGTIVTPAAFITAAERFHMATLIDRWVVRRALTMLRKAQADGVVIAMVSINVSGQSISDPTFRLDMADELVSAGIDLSRVCFEITETVLATNFADADAFVREMHRLGVRISVDDFGAGAASFGTLKKLPVDHIDFLKIDGEFIRSSFADALDGVAVRFFQELARTIGAATIAEWVQDAPVRRTLGELGVDFVQGFLIHRPEPFEQLLARYMPHRQLAADSV